MDAMKWRNIIAQGFSSALALGRDEAKMRPEGAPELVLAQRRYSANTEALKELLGFLYAECCTRNKAIKPETIASVCACCGNRASADEPSCDPITSNLYDGTQKGEIPDTALKASLGCGNPTAVAELKPGEIVLDLGSGGGIDVLLSARRVGPTGKAYGLDMTDERLSICQDRLDVGGIGVEHENSVHRIETSIQIDCKTNLILSSVV